MTFGVILPRPCCVRSSPADDEGAAEVVLSDALCLLVTVGGGLADAAQARQRDVVVRGSALPLLTWKKGERRKVHAVKE